MQLRESVLRIGKGPMKKGNLRPGRLVVESAAIFLSVLLAFVVERWREERNERQEAAAERIQNANAKRREAGPRGNPMSTVTKTSRREHRITVRSIARAKRRASSVY